LGVGKEKNKTICFKYRDNDPSAGSPTERLIFDELTKNPNTMLSHSDSTIS